MPQIPNEPFLRELYAKWQTQPDLEIIRDPRIGRTITVDTLLRDIIKTREELLSALSESVKSQLKPSSAEQHQDVFIVMLATPGYRFVVSFLAIFSIGAVTVPLSPGVLPEEAEYFVKLCNASLIVATSDHKDAASKISDLTSVATITPTESETATSHDEIQLAANPEFDLERGGSMLFTSGTTSRPKGVVHSRRALYDHAKSDSDFLNFSSEDLFLLPGPLHWMGGFGMLVFCIYSTMRMEFAATLYSPSWFWQRIQEGDITCLIPAVSMLTGLEAEYHKSSPSWSDATREAVLAGVRKLRILSSGASPVPTRLQTFWTDLRGGKPLHVTYGSTEGLLFITSSREDDMVPPKPGCVGVPLDGVEVKLDANDQILLKTKGMFTRYISENPDITAAAFDEEGWFKTGDVGRLEGEDLYILGRASIDVIRYNGWRIFGPEVEDSLLQLPNIASAWVVPVPDDITGQRVAALVSSSSDPPDLKSLRDQLSTTQEMNTYKLPTMLRILEEGETVPKTSTGKPSKRHIVTQFFGRGEVEKGVVEVWDEAKAAIEGKERRPFDWAGIQYS